MMLNTKELLRYDPTNNAVVPVKDKSSRRRRPLAPNEEYTTKKKVEVKTTTNTERRIQRQVVLEDGRILAKNDPEIIVDKVEDLETQETEQAHDDLPESLIRRLNQEKTSGKKVVKDSFRRTVNTRDVTENIHSTRVSKDLGLISKKALKNVLKNKEVTPDDVIRRSEVQTRRGNDQREVMASPRETKTTTYKAESRKRIVDTTDVHDICHLENGKLKSETYKTETHEIFDDRRIPSDGSSLSGSKPSLRANDVQKYSVSKRENFTDYYRPGVNKDDPLIKVGSGPNVTSEDRNIHRGITHDWTKMEEKIRRNRRIMNIDGNNRTDVVTKKPLNYAHEEKNRRNETDKWLDQHFGSDWSLTNSSTHNPNRKKAEGSTTIRRTMSFSSVHNPNMSRLVKQTTKTIDPVSGEEKVTYATMSRIDPAVNTSTLSLPITRIDIGSSSSGSGRDTRHHYQNEDEIRAHHASYDRRENRLPQYHYINKDTENSVGSTYVTNFRAAPPKAVSTSSSSGPPSEKNHNSGQHIRHVNIEVHSEASPPLIHDRIQRLRTEHSSRSRNKKITPSSTVRNHRQPDEEERQFRSRNIEETKSISSSTSQIHKITEKTHFNSNNRIHLPFEKKSTPVKYRSKSSQPLYRTELRREQYYPLEATPFHQIKRPQELEVKIIPSSPKRSTPSPQENQFLIQNSTTKYIQIEPKPYRSLDRGEEPKSYRSLERNDGVESPSAIHNIPLRKFVSEERNHYYYDRKNEFIHSTPIKKAISKPSGLDTYKPTQSPPPLPGGGPPTASRRKQFREQYLLESKIPLRNHHPGAEYMSPRKHMERSESEQNHRYQSSSSHHTSTIQRTSRSMSNRPKYPEPPETAPALRSKSKKPRGKNGGERTHSFLVKTASGGSSGNEASASRKVYHEHPLVEAEVQRLDNSMNENLLHTNNFGGSSSGGGVWSGLLGKLSPNRRSISTAKLNQISSPHSSSPLNKFGGSARDLYFASPGHTLGSASPTARSYYETADPQKFKTIIFLSGK